MNTAREIAANRFGLGARPGELQRLQDPAQWLLAQLEVAPPVLSDPALKPAAETLARAIQLRKEVI